MSELVSEAREIRYPWDWQRVPNHESAPSVETVDADRLDVDTFRRRYVRLNRPVLIKGAVRHWPAFTRWREADYLPSRIGDVKVRASCRPRIEGFGLRSAEQDALAGKQTREARLPPATMREVIARIRTPDDEVLFFDFSSSQKETRSLGEDLQQDGRRFPFLPAPPSPQHFYPDWGAMLCKNSYSDWHYHAWTEAVMCQVLGTKDTLLLPPTQGSWDQIVPIHREQWKVYDVDTSKAPAWRNVRPLHVVVEGGDGLFLPVNWWHAVQSRPREFAITVPVWWNSTYRDLRQPATRHHLRALWPKERVRATRQLLAALYGTATSPILERLTPSRSPNGVANGHR